MISIGGVIGTGLFLGTANALKNGGPLGLLLGYAAMGAFQLAQTRAATRRQAKPGWIRLLPAGSVCYSVMISLGSMISYLPIPGGHIRVSLDFSLGH
jgi:amino acid transporter